MPNELLLYGEINDSDGPKVKALLSAMDQTEPLTVRIDSPGGSVFAGFAIFKALQDYSGPKTAVIEPAAFSIASYIPMACDEIEITDNGYLMIHNPSVDSGGDDEDHARDAKLLANLKQDMVRAYSQRTGLGEPEVLALMKAETYFNAADAVSSGFATRVASTKNEPRASCVAKLERFNDMPYRVCASLLGDGPRGDKVKTKEKPMSEKNVPVAATVKQIKAIYPKAKHEFIVRCMEEELTAEEVTETAMEELQAENEELRAKLTAMEEEQTAKAKAMEEEEEAKAKAMEEEEQAKAKAKGNRALAIGSGGGVSAKSRWDDAIHGYVAKGVDRVKAVRLANKNNPGLRQAMLEEVNATR